MNRAGVEAAVVVPNWNGIDSLAACLDSLVKQSQKAHIIVVDNGSSDGSLELVKNNYPQIELIEHSVNKGFAGGVNPGFKRAMKLKLKYAASFNNDAVADKDWLKHLMEFMDRHSKVGIATCKLLTAGGDKLDSSGDFYTVWGLPYPRGRGESDTGKYDETNDIFGASGGASLYRCSLLEKVGLFDEDFFAYYEDVDLSFRAQLAGWKVAYVPAAVAYHQIGATSRRLKGFSTYQTMKNVQLIYYKNLPRRFMWRVGWRLFIAQGLFIARAFTRREGWSAVCGDVKGSLLLLKKRGERKHIQATKAVDDDYIWSIIVHDLPPNARALRRLRRLWGKIKV